MFILYIIGLIGLGGFVLSSTIYLVEAYKQSLNRFLAALFIPFYILYFALINSKRPDSNRFILITSIVLIALPLIAEPFFLGD